MGKLQIFILAALFLFSCSSEQKKADTLMSFFPATQTSLAGVNVFSPENADLMQYYVKDGKWTPNENIPKINTTIKGGNYRMQYMPNPNGGAPNMLLYSATSGEFVFYYLDQREWKVNPLLPGGAISYPGKNVNLEFTPGNGSSTAFMFANSSDGKELRIMEVQDGRWVYISYFPSKI